MALRRERAAHTFGWFCSARSTQPRRVIPRGAAGGAIEEAGAALAGGGAIEEAEAAFAGGGALPRGASAPTRSAGHQSAMPTIVATQPRRPNLIGHGG